MCIKANLKTVQPLGEIVVVDQASGSEEFVLTDASLQKLDASELGDISLFQFAEDSDVNKRFAFGSCKTFPGDVLWPSKLTWDLLSLLTGGTVFETVPIGAVCYKNNKHYNAAQCQEILDHWTKTATQ